MSKQYPRSEELASNSSEATYLMYNSEDVDSQQKAMASLDGAVDQYCGRVYSSDRRHIRFDPGSVGGDGVAGRYGMTHSDYELWRPNEKSTFRNPKAAMSHADYCYHRHGLIKNVIDLMGDFASQGIRLVHPNKRIEKFYRNWFRRVNGVERSERFLNNLYRIGQVVIRRQTAKINAKHKQNLFKARAESDMEVTNLEINKNEIPWKYTYLHPVTVEVLGGALANFSGKPLYGIKIPMSLRNRIKNPRNDFERKMVAELPREIRKAADSHKEFPLDPEKTEVYHYKKDDWQEWAFPIISSIALDISLYEKLKLADRAALDGAISNIRIFKLGNLEHKIVPTERAAAKLASILESNVEAGTLDLIWGPDIELIESKTAVHQFLGQEKYEPTLIAIYAGLGIPPTLTGTFGAAGTTNNFISLKTLTQRLEYGRDQLISFWDKEIRIVQEAMGFRFPARVEFDLMNLGDEVSEKALLIQLADRNLISDELLQHYFGSDPEMERIRTNTENNERDKDRRVPKSSPFHDPQFEETLKKVFAQSGVVTPSEVGVELENRKSGEQPALKMKVPPKPSGSSPSSKKKGQPQQGRPRTSKDQSGRTTKTFKPKVKAGTAAIWAKAAQLEIARILNPVLLENYGKSNMRSLSSDKAEEAEKIRFGVLCNLEPFSKIDSENIMKALEKPIPSVALSTYTYYESQALQELDLALLTIEQRNDIRSFVYAALHTQNENSE